MIMAGTAIAYILIPNNPAYSSHIASRVLAASTAPKASAKTTPAPTVTPTKVPAPKPRRAPIQTPSPAQSAAAALSSALTAQSKAASLYGFAAGSSLPNLSLSALDIRLNGMKALGVGWIRFDFDWGNIEPSQGQFNWSAYDQIVSAASSRGIRTIGIIDYAPTWARSSSCRGSFACEPSSPSAYGTFAAAVASHYAAFGVHTWEIWNEPNNTEFFQPSADPATYTAMLKSAYVDIKQVDSGATVLTGGLAPEYTGNGYMSPPDFITAIYANGAAGYFDAVADHPYTFPVTAAYNNPQGAWAQMSSIHQIMAWHGDGNKLIWITEYGAPTGGPGQGTNANNYDVQNSSWVTEAFQSQMVTDFFNQASALPWLGPRMWYSYQDAGTTQDTNENFFGLIRADGSLKPAYYAFAQAMAGVH